MTKEDEKEIVALMRAAREKARGYADFYSWPIDRDIEEWGVANTLFESLLTSGEAFFTDLLQRGRGNDPPDCEAMDDQGKRIAIEVTELVSSDAIKAYKQGHVYDWADWTKEALIESLNKLIAAKGARYAHLKGGAYEGGYVILIHTDEPTLPIETVRKFLADQTLDKPEGVARVFLLLSYDPQSQSCPYIELSLSA